MRYNHYVTSGASSSNPTGKYISSELLEIAIELAQTGDKKAVRELLQLIVKENPSDELAWIWYANTSPTIQERVQTLEEFRKRNPENQRIKYLCESLIGSIVEGQNTIVDGTFPGNTYACPNCANTIANTYLTCPFCGAEVTPLRPPSLSTPTQPIAASPTASPDVPPFQLSFLDQLALEPAQSETELHNSENNGSLKNHLGLALDLYISGEKKGARELLEAITKEDPQNELAWIWYANTFPTPQERIRALYKFLTTNPQNQRVHDYCKFLRETIETPKTSAPAEPSPSYTQSEQSASMPDSELGLVDFLHRSQYYQILAPSTQTIAHKSKPILIGLSKSARQLRCPNCLRYHVAERYPINWKSAILNAFLLVITLGLWTIYLLRNETSNWKPSKKYICTACGYSWS
jgi:Tfp pilus assembly protein PilF